MTLKEFQNTGRIEAMALVGGRKMVDAVVADLAKTRPITPDLQRRITAARNVGR